MPSLSELQSAFAAAVFGVGEAGVERWIDAGALPPGERVAIYRRDVFHNLGEALRDVYPVVERLVGADFFGAAARRFVRAFPSTGGNLHGFGGEFPDFLAGHAPAADLCYLADTARLEWLVHVVFHAADATAFDLGRLAQVAPADYDRLRFTVAPTCGLLFSPYPVDRIWAANQPDCVDVDAVDLAEGEVRLAVRREGFAIVLAPLGAGEFALLSALAAGELLGAAASRARVAEPAFDLGAALQRAIGDGVLAGCGLGPD
jgi:hypothetical protein